MTQARRVGIAGMGYYLPENIVTNSDLEKKIETSDEWIRTRTGIRERRIAGPDQAASDLGVIAAEKALEDAQLSADLIDIIIVATASPDMVFPATACLIQDRIGAVNAGAFDLSAVCSGFIYAFVTAAQMITAGTAERVMVVATEKFSSFLDWEDRSTAVLMGDGAGAVILSADATTGEVLSNILGADSSGIEHLYVPAGGAALPASHETVAQRQHYMKMNGPEIYKFGVRIIVESVSQALEKAGLQEDALDLLIPHQANIRIIQSASKRLNLPMEKIFINIANYSNTSAASVPIALYEAKQKGMLKKGMNIALVAFGAGLSWGASIIRW
ncbi:ketoacyl-ACP synthase III [bacterium]|nr:ketoacyl-ACP synthase III [bacterium]